MILPRRRNILRQVTQLAALTVIIFAAYFPALNNGFIWDDDRYIQANIQLRDLHGLQRIWLDPLHAEPQYYPLTHTTLWLEYQAWKAWPFAYHLDNILLHVAVAALLWRILRRLKVPGSLLAATLFAVHPLQVETVAWATERKNLLSGLLYFASLWSYLHTRAGRRILEPGPTANPGWGWYASSLLLFAAALLSKSVAATLPAAILLLLWFKRGRVQTRDIFPLLPMLIAGLAMGTLTGWMEKHVVGAMGPAFDALTPIDRLCIAGRAFWFYLAKLISPLPLVFIYPQWHVNPLQRAWWFCFPVAALALLVACWLLRRRMGRGPLATLLLFAVTIVPALGFVNVYPMQFSYVADHFQYLAGVAPIVYVVAEAKRLGRSWRKPQVISGALCGLIALCCALTNARTCAYRNSLTLWADTVAKNPDSPMVLNNYANALRNDGQLEAAKIEFHKAMRLRSDAKDWIGLGQCYSVAGDFSTARDMYQKALDITPESQRTPDREFRASLEFQLGTAYQALAQKYPDQSSDDDAKAEAAYRRAIALFPQYEDPRKNLANLLLQQKRYAESIDECQAMLAQDPRSISAHLNLGTAHYAEGQLDSALAEYQRVLDLDPDNAGAIASIGAILCQQGKSDEGIAMLREALKIDPANALARVNLKAAESLAANKNSAPQK